MSESAHIEAARQRLRDGDQARAERYQALWARAESDSKAILEMIVREYQPTRLYQTPTTNTPPTSMICTCCAGRGT